MPSTHRIGLHRYRIKLLVSYIVISLVPIFFIGYDLYDKSINNIKSINQIASQNIMAQYEKNIEMALLQMEALANNIQINLDINRNLKNYNKSPNKTLDNKLHDQFNAINSISTDFSVQVITSGNVVFGKSIIHLGLKDFMNIKATFLNNQKSWILRDQINVNGPSLSNSIFLIRPYIDIETVNNTGLIVVQAKKQYFDRLFSSSQHQSGHFYLTNENGMLISGSHDYIPGVRIGNFNHKINIPFIDKILTSKRDIIEVENDLLLFDTIHKNQWKIIGYIPHINSIDWMKNVKNDLFILSVFVVLLSLCFAIILTNTLFHPLEMLQNGIDKFGKGDTEHQIIVEGYEDFQSIIVVFNNMVLRINRLLNKKIQIERLKRKSELMALNSQINPHFLYNTLESIKWIAEESGNTELSGVIIDLSKFFKMGLSRGNDLIPIHDEIIHVKSYLKIQEFRYSDRFSYRIEDDPSIGRLLIPKITLQPLVENSIYHGLQDKKGEVIIKIIQLENDIELTVIDNGRGIEQKRLKEINEQLNIEKVRTPTVYGIKNIDQRIKLWFGQSYGLSIRNGDECGTVVTVKIPSKNTRDQFG